MKNNITLKKLSYLFLSFALITSFVSCNEVESVPDDSDILIQEVVGQWVVDITRNGDFQANIHMNTYNTSANETTAMWVDDLNNYYGLKTKVDFDLTSKTFSSTDSDELYYGVTVTVSDGVITRNGATAPGSGDTVDSISFSVVFSDDPTGVWGFTGYKSTGKIADQ
jgi:hypothetical protein